MSQLCIERQKNLGEEKGVIWFELEELDGVPSDAVDTDLLEKGNGENKGKVKLSFSHNHYFSMLKYAKDGEVRRRYVIADANKANINIPLFQENLELRDEGARLLGYGNHASVRIAPKIAKNTKTFNDFLDGLRARLATGGKQEAERLIEYKRKDYEERGQTFDGNLHMWDTSLYSRVMKEKDYKVDEIAISQFFPVETTFQRECSRSSRRSSASSSLSWRRKIGPD